MIAVIESSGNGRPTYPLSTSFPKLVPSYGAALLSRSLHVGIAGSAWRCQPRGLTRLTPAAGISGRQGPRDRRASLASQSPSHTFKK